MPKITIGGKVVLDTDKKEEVTKPKKEVKEKEVKETKKKKTSKKGAK